MPFVPPTLFRRVLPVLLALALPLLPAMAEEVTLDAQQDATIYRNFSGDTTAGNGEIGNGAGQRLFVGATQGGTLRRALVQFDVAGSIPAGATITAASLVLAMDRTAGGANLIGLHRVTEAWTTGASDADGTGTNEGNGTQSLTGDATWLHTSYNTSTWTSAGGSFTAEASATANVDPVTSYSWTGPSVTADVQSWLDEGNNHGWLLMGGEEVDGSAKRFHSLESATAASRPKLVVTYTPASEGEGEGEPISHSADQDGDGSVGLSELLRVIQFYNSTGYGCQAGTEDGYAPNDADQNCAPHASDYATQDWAISLSELLRLIQFYNLGAYHPCP